MSSARPQRFRGDSRRAADPRRTPAEPETAAVPVTGAGPEAGAGPVTGAAELETGAGPETGAGRSVSPHERARGATINPANRFTLQAVELDAEALQAAWEAERAEAASDEREDPASAASLFAPTATQVFRDTTRTILTRNDSPDVGFNVSLNPYRGCEHGCIYCYARPTHEYLGMSAGLDFETRIVAKFDAPDLLRKELQAAGYVPEPLSMCGVTDAYQPVERVLCITRGCLQVLSQLRHPVGIVTKSTLVLRDLDLLQPLAEVGATRVWISLSTLDPLLKRQLEPRAASPARKLAAIRTLRDAGIPVGVMAAPMIPGLNDHELPSILTAAVEAGADCAGYVMLRLPHAVKELFAAWLAHHRPGEAAKVLGRIREVRAGSLNATEFGERMRGSGPYAEQIRSLFHVSRRRLGLPERPVPLSAAAFRRPGRTRSLFG